MRCRLETETPGRQKQVEPQTYVAVDGDDIGRHLEYLMLTNDLEGLRTFSTEYRRGLAWFSEAIRAAFGGDIVFEGGDNLLAALNQPPTKEALEAIRTEFATRMGETLSIGIGHSIRQAYLALSLAKTGGKDRICSYEELDDD